MTAKEHWEQIYQTKDATQVSWFQAQPRLSLDLIRRAAPGPAAPIIDVGGGASTLVDHLLAEGFQAVTVLDISAQALQTARARLGALAAAVTWLEADITAVSLPAQTYAVWHDRAVFHFLTQSVDRQRYVAAARQAVRPGGWVVVAAFALEGPERCSGLEVVRYSPAGLSAELGAGFELVDSVAEIHRTPAGGEQAFTYCVCRRV